MASVLPVIATSLFALCFCIDNAVKAEFSLYRNEDTGLNEANLQDSLLKRFKRNDDSDSDDSSDEEDMFCCRVPWNSSVIKIAKECGFNDTLFEYMEAYDLDDDPESHFMYALRDDENKTLRNSSSESGSYEEEYMYNCVNKSTDMECCPAKCLHDKLGLLDKNGVPKSSDVQKVYTKMLGTGTDEKFAKIVKKASKRCSKEMKAFLEEYGDSGNIHYCGLNFDLLECIAWKIVKECPESARSKPTNGVCGPRNEQ